MSEMSLDRASAWAILERSPKKVESSSGQSRVSRVFNCLSLKAPVSSKMVLSRDVSCHSAADFVVLLREFL